MLEAISTVSCEGTTVFPQLFELTTGGVLEYEHLATADNIDTLVASGKFRDGGDDENKGALDITEPMTGFGGEPHTLQERHEYRKKFSFLHALSMTDTTMGTMWGFESTKTDGYLFIHALTVMEVDSADANAEIFQQTNLDAFAYDYATTAIVVAAICNDYEYCLYMELAVQIGTEDYSATILKEYKIKNLEDTDHLTNVAAKFLSGA